MMLAVVDVASTDARVVVLLGFFTLVGVVVAAWFGYLGQREGRAAGAIARRVEEQVTPNGGTTKTTGDATVRIESQLALMQTLVAQAVAELQAAVTRDDGRFARSERDMAALRDQVAAVGTAMGQLTTDHQAIMAWIEQHTDWAHTEVTEAHARYESAAERLAALERADIERRERGEP